MVEQAKRSEEETDTPDLEVMDILSLQKNIYILEKKSLSSTGRPKFNVLFIKAKRVRALYSTIYNSMCIIY